MTIKLAEAGVLGKVSGKKTWYGRIIAVGSGSSGFHTEKAIKETGPAAWPIGTKVNADHQSFEEYLSQPAGSIKTLMGVVASTPEFKDDGTDLAGLYAHIEFSEEWAPFVEQFAPFLGLSITANGWGEETTEEGQTIIEGYIPSVLNTVDVVTAAGAKGMLIEAIESYKESDTLISKIVEISPVEDREEMGMKPEDIQSLAEALATALAPSFTKITEALTPAVAAPDADEDKVDNNEVIEALVAAGLPKTGRARVLEAVDGGLSVADAIAAEKEYVAEVLQESTANVGRVTEAATGKFDATVKGW